MALALSVGQYAQEKEERLEMWARKEKGRLVQPRAAVEIDDEIAEALRFSKEESSLRSQRLAAVFEENANTLRRPPLKPGTKIAQRPALPSEIENIRDSFVTVPPVVASLLPPNIPVARGLPSISYVAADRTVPLAPITSAFAAAVTASRDGAAGFRTWAVLMSIGAVALPSGLLLRQVFVPRAAAAGSAQPATVASTLEPKPDAAEAFGALLVSTPNVVSDPVDDPPAIAHTRHPTRHGNARAAATAAASPVSSSDSRAKQSYLPSSPAK